MVNTVELYWIIKMTSWAKTIPPPLRILNGPTSGNDRMIGIFEGPQNNQGNANVFLNSNLFNIYLYHSAYMNPHSIHIHDIIKINYVFRV